MANLKQLSLISHSQPSELPSIHSTRHSCQPNFFFPFFKRPPCFKMADHSDFFQQIVFFLSWMKHPMNFSSSLAKRFFNFLTGISSCLKIFLSPTFTSEILLFISFNSRATLHEFYERVFYEFLNFSFNDFFLFMLRSHYKSHYSPHYSKRSRRFFNDHEFVF